MTSSLNKVTFTACCIIPPKELWEPIQAIRSKHDSAYERWMPHVNYMFPFVHPSKFQLASEELTKALVDVQPFEVTLKEFSHFDHGKKCVMWLKPDVESTQLQDLLQKMLTVFPQCDDQSNKNVEKVFHPHLTVGQFAKNELERKKKQFQQGWKPVTFTVNEIYIISRPDQVTPFSVQYAVPLGGSK